MKIEEKDLFLYVFHRELLLKDKREYIDSNLPLFKESISFLENYKKELDEVPSGMLKEITKEVLKKADEAGNKTSGLFTLEKKCSDFFHSSNVKLAADPVQLCKQKGIDTFADKNSNYLIKVMYEKEETKVYVIDRNYNPIFNFDLIIYPEEKSYHLEDNNNPLILNHGVVIDKIDIVIN